MEVSYGVSWALRGGDFTRHESEGIPEKVTSKLSP